MTFDATLTIRSNLASRRVRLSEYLDAAGAEATARQANDWIKSLRLARVDGLRFRERFMYRGDSLWWFAELYLHKERVVLGLFRAIHAGTALLERERPSTLKFEEGGELPRLVLPQLTRTRGVSYEGPPLPQLSRVRLALMDARSTGLMMGAVGSMHRPVRRQPTRATAIAAFVHRAFWRGREDDGSAESYIGPVLQAIEKQVPAGGLQYVGVGPATNFRARRWWRPAASTPDTVTPIEALAPRTSLAGSSGIWAARHAMRRVLENSADLRRASVIADCDCWPRIAEALAGVALLQFTWSARAMDEASAAFETLRPAVALTYAEAGGWGRALALEARRHSIPFVGLQHGFIYRHWLNYLHEPDEMLPLTPGSADAGFPHPTSTLLFDEYAARHLREAGHFPPGALRVTGSPRLDQLATVFHALSDADVQAARQAAGADASQALVLLVTKYSEAKGVLTGLLEAVRSMPDVQLAIKAHPAETTAPYEADAAHVPNVRVLPASAPLAPLMRTSRAIVTVNSTVALDGLALGVHALSLGLPNNLSPFVDAGAIAGARTDAETAGVLRQLLYDEQFRARLSAASRSIVATWRMAPDGAAADRAAAIVLELA
ncbi:MAG: hypothetical protein ACRD1U_02790, partial [Vicinamibacterales bacterium]